ncbi:KRI1-like family C-terminal-domain-containing protein [Chaetomidium leptoderma]|uniref:KRI1-like family C-terminal-domain-containing protein n=1 Tax=Chaetomidium leptoderma TaxID=669021 RepID=A0AAN6VRH3_9PEZI|nr:KRI1-like family C-terminal-domain-containing protein [Chaetomidium leptoderma]
MAPASAKSAKGASHGDKMGSKQALFEDSSSSSEDDQEDGGATLAASELKINEEYARRFEHNKKREEIHRLEEKYKTADGGESESSSDDSEDDQAVLATEDLDAEISATLQAIKNKDPRIYDKDAVFYTPFDPAAAPKTKEDKPVFLRDYHRERYLSGDVGADEDSAAAADVPRTYVQEQDDMKQSILSEIKAAAAAADDEEEWSDDDAFIKPVKKADVSAENGIHPSRAAKINLTEVDVATADKNPEDYLSKFMASKAWAPEGAGSKWQAFESDDGEDADDVADEFEHAYNMRFEDPTKSNEFLKTYSRNMAASRSARKEELTGRKRLRALEKERKEAENKERDTDRARLRRLKVEEASDKLAKIKKAAGMSGKGVTEEEWMKFLEDAWDDDKWEEEMKKRFNDDYYAEADDLFRGEDDDDDEEGEDEADKKKKKPKKPKWDDDIDINDIVPDFDDEVKPDVVLSDDDEAQEPQAEEDASEDDSDDERPAKKRKTTKDIKNERIAAKRQARAELAKIEALVDTKMELDNPRALQSKSSTGGGFRYRETSPTSFGLTARDILLAPNDTVLNEFAGLKKLATFRDAEKKRKDKKRLGKKARLRQWRRETFGRKFEESGPTFGFEALVGEGEKRSGSASGANAVRKAVVPARKEKKPESGEAGTSGIIEGERKKKRKRSKNKGKKAVEADE